jgi:uncharacterized protein
MPKSVSLSLGSPIKAIHSSAASPAGASPTGGKGSTSMLVRLTYHDGSQEEHPLVNGEHIADYIRRVDVPQSEFAFDLDGRQLRYLTVSPRRPEPIVSIDLVKGPDNTAPVVMALTVEMP